MILDIIALTLGWLLVVVISLAGLVVLGEEDTERYETASGQGLFPSLAPPVPFNSPFREVPKRRSISRTAVRK